MRRGLQVRFVMVIFMVMLAGCATAGLLTATVLNANVGSNLKESQQAIAEMMIELAEETNFSLEKIMTLCAREPYGIVRVGLPIDGDIQFISNPLFIRSETLVRVRDATARIYLRSNKIIVLFFSFSTLATAGASVMFGTGIASVVSRRVMRPVDELADAIERVAGGDFTTRVRVPHNPAFRRVMAGFNKMALDLAGTEALQTDFVNNVSHEFRTPLSSIHGFAKLLQNPSLTDAERAEYTQVIVDETRRLSGLATDLLNLSRLENQTIVTDRVPFWLDEQIRQAALLLESEWSAKALDLNVELDPVEITGNEELMRPVWLNLLGNAIKFTPAGGTVSVRLIDAEDEVIIRVRDTGIGMDDEVRLHIFDKFYQGDASHAKNGAGLGLPLARRIVELCGGEIAVRSEPGNGSTFSVTLPKG